MTESSKIGETGDGKAAAAPDWTVVSSATVYDLSYMDDRGSKQLLLIGYDKSHAIHAALAHLRAVSGPQGYAKRTRSGWIARNDPHRPEGRSKRTVNALMLVHGSEGDPSGVRPGVNTERHAVLRERRADGITTGRRFEARFATVPDENIFFPEETDGNPSGIVRVSFDEQHERKARHLAPQPTIHVLNAPGA
ncbi:hypothetical protein [Leucobacter tenebrionis]|uniref:hypothetical protein n=1 Tax=Leucobacter tenebrionis TaxID=2873270 RepID=UPI001CA69BD0|nr:hypothetical protein [Leucobacter tenebrionis]QZY52256.1 hypothetical protein KVY00_01940 [Leucobacter tenebrionis]